MNGFRPVIDFVGTTLLNIFSALHDLDWRLSDCYPGTPADDKVAPPERQ